MLNLIVSDRIRQAVQDKRFGRNFGRNDGEAKVRLMRLWRHFNIRPGQLKISAEKRRQYQKARGAVDTARRRANLLRATPPWVDQKALRAIYAEAAKRGLHVDHIHPLKGENFCGLHVPWNLQLLAPKDNLRKSNKLLQVFQCTTICATRF